MNKKTQLTEKIERCKRVVSELKALYPDAICSLEYDSPLHLLISVRLSAQCTDKRVNMVTPALFDAFPTLDDLCDAEVEAIEHFIKPCGLFHTKARDIKNMCIDIRDRFGGSVPDNMDDLLTLHGVGRKTANLIMGDVYGAPAIVADTHCIRISGRLGLTDSTKDPLKVERQLLEVVAPEESNALCHRFVLFGRDVCTARSPKCVDCPLSAFCPSAQSNQ
ncbi:MAG: endonuclease III [Clostridia bacterium]|nr:endonuclease III [Clostridia bacterium]